MIFPEKPTNIPIRKVACGALVCFFALSLGVMNSAQAYEHDPNITVCIVCHCPQTVSTDCSDSGCHGPGAMDNCFWCHDGSQSSAPDVGLFNTSGHGRFGIDCIDCHDSSIPHDGVERTYAFDSSQYEPLLSGVAYAAGYRLKYVSGEVPLMIPANYNITFGYDAQTMKANAFKLCFNCHDSSKILDNTPGDGIDSSFKASLPNPPRDYSYAWGSGADVNEHVSHTMNYVGPFWDSDWDTTTTGEGGSNGLDSLLACSSCHNIHGAAATHGSTNEPMIRDGSLTGRAGYGFSYVVEDVGAGGYPMVTSTGATQSISVGAVLRNNTADMCGGSMCHGNPVPPPASSYDATGSSWGTYIEYYRPWQHYISLPEFALTYGGSGPDCAYSIRPTADGGYIVSGHTDSFLTNEGHSWVLKLNPNGTVAWENTYGGPAGQGAVCIDKTFDQGTPDGYIVAGGPGPPDADFGVLRLNLDGTKAWQKTYGGDDDDIAYCIQSTSDRGYIVMGYTNSFPGGPGHAWILKLDTSGSIAWENSYSGPGSQGGRSIKETFVSSGTPDGYIAAGGPAGDGPGSGPDGYEFGLLRLNGDGTKVWQKTYGGYDVDTAYGVVQSLDSQGNPDGYVVVGATKSFGAGKKDAWVLKINPNGSVAWEYAYGGAESDYAKSVYQAGDGGYLVAGSTKSFGAGNEDVWVFKINSSGVILWQKAYGGANKDWAESVQQTSDGGCVVAGTTKSFGAGKGDLLVLKLNVDGEIPGCTLMEGSNASRAGTSAVVTDITWWDPYGTSADVYDILISPEATSADLLDPCGIPIIEKVKPKSTEPGKIIRIIGRGFGTTQGASEVHVNNKTYGPGHTKIKEWSETGTKIRVRLPKYDCDWFGQNDSRSRKIWVTIGGVDSNVKKIKILKPGTCP